jgi:hypothetical protein
MPPPLDFVTDEPSSVCVAGADDPLSPCYSLAARGDWPTHCLLDGAGALFACREGRATLVARTVRALAPAHKTLVVLHMDADAAPPGGRARTATLPGVGPAALERGGDRTARLVRVTPEKTELVGSITGNGSFRAFIGCGAPDTLRSTALLAVNDRSESWGILFDGVEMARVTPNAKSEVVGVVLDQGTDGVGPALVVVQSDRRAIWAQGERRGRALTLASAPVAHVALSHATRAMAYTTERGELVVFSLEHGVALRRVVPEG